MLDKILMLGEYLEYIRLNTSLQSKTKVKFIISGLKGIKANLEQIPELKDFDASKDCVAWIERLTTSYKDRGNELIEHKDARALYKDAERWRREIVKRLGQ